MLLRSLPVLACLAIFAVSGQADVWNKKTNLTVNVPTRVAGTLLPPGKYVMKLIDSLADRHIVCIMNEKEDQVITTILAIPNYRLKVTGDTQFDYWETPASAPKAMRAWFYPGDNFGQEFVYPKTRAIEIAQTASLPVPAVAEAVPEKELAKAPITEIEKTGEERPLVTEVKPAQPAPVAVVEPAPEPSRPEPSSQPATPEPMPKTASELPVILLSALAAFALGFACRGLAHTIR